MMTLFSGDKNLYLREFIDEILSILTPKSSFLLLVITYQALE